MGSYMHILKTHENDAEVTYTIFPELGPDAQMIVIDKVGYRAQAEGLDHPFHQALWCAAAEFERSGQWPQQRTRQS